MRHLGSASLRAPGHRPGRAGERGYNLVILAVVVTVMSILLAAALPLWSTIIRRDKEEELRFRGLQYAEAIRVFQARYGRNPVRLEELIEVKPRCIRQLWRDPFAADGRWGLAYQGVPPGGTVPGQQVPGQPGGQNLPGSGTGGVFGGGDEPPPPIPTGPDSFEPGEFDLSRARQTTVTVGPIVGVFSLSSESSFSSFFGQETYRQWVFTSDLFQRPSVEAGVAPQSNLGSQARWIGRPWRPFVQEQQPPGTVLPGGTGPSGKPGSPGGGIFPGGGVGGGGGGGRPGGGGVPGKPTDDDSPFPPDDVEPGGGGAPGGGGVFPGSPGRPGGGGGGGGKPGGGQQPPFPDNQSIELLRPAPPP